MDSTMSSSDNTYDEFTDVDDPVAHSEMVFRREFMKMAKWQNSKGYDEDMVRWIIDNTIDRAADTLKNQKLEEALTNLATRVVQSQQFQDACGTLIKNLWSDLVNDPETTAQVVELLNNAIQHEHVQESVRKLILTLVQDKEVYNELTRLLVRLGKEPKVRRFGNTIDMPIVVMAIFVGPSHKRRVHMHVPHLPKRTHTLTHTTPCF